MSKNLKYLGCEISQVFYSFLILFSFGIIDHFFMLWNKILDRHLWQASPDFGERDQVVLCKDLCDPGTLCEG